MITISKLLLLPVLERCAKVASKDANQVQLSHVKLDFNDVLEYSATNLVTSIRGAIDASGKPDSFTVNVKELLNVAKSVIGDDVKLSRNEKGKLKVSGEGKRSFTCDTLSADDFPKVELADGPWTELPGESLRELVNRVLFASGNDQDSEGLRCIRVRVLDGILSAAAANGRALGLATDAIESKATITAIVPKGCLNAILSTTADRIDMAVSDRFIYFRIGTETVIAKTIAEEGNFPPIEVAVDNCFANRTHIVSLDSQVLSGALSAVRRVDSRAMVDLTFSKNEMRIEVGQEGSAGYATDTVSVQGEETGEVRLDIDYLTGALKGCANVTFSFGENLEPVTITDGMYKAIIMPMRKT